MLSRGRKYLLSAAATSLAASLVLFGGPAVAKADPTTVAGASATCARHAPAGGEPVPAGGAGSGRRTVARHLATP